MQEKAETPKIQAVDKLKHFALENRKWFGAAGYACTGLVMANSSIFGGISPFGVAFCAAVNGPEAVAASLGAIAGYILSVTPGSNMKYIAAVLLVAAAKILFGPKRAGLPLGEFTLKHNALTAVLTVLLSMLVASAAVALSTDYTMYEIFLAGSEILLACGSAYFFTRGLSSLKVGWNGASKIDVSCVVISFAIIVMGLSGLEIANLSIGRIISALAVMLCARYGSEAGGSVAGVTAGIAMSLAGGDPAYVVAAYGFGGLVSGVFGAMGRIPAAASFIVVNAVVAFLTQDSVSVYHSVLEVFVASVGFAAIPQGWMSRLRPLKTTPVDSDNYVRGILRDRLSDVSVALAEIGATTKKVSEGLEKMDAPGSGEVAARVAERVCQKCNMKNTCWQFSYREAMDAMNASIATLKRSGSITKFKMPKYFLQTCVNLEQLITELNFQFQNHAAREGVARKVAQVRSVVADQFEGLSLLIDEIAVEICEARVLDEKKARRVRDYFEKEGFEAKRVQVCHDEYDRACVSLSIPNYQLARLHKAKAALDLCGLLEAEFDMPEVTVRQNNAALIFTEKATFAIEVGAYQLASGGGRLCGDAYDYISNKSGRAHFILSDGMGSGGAAAVDSSMASGLITQLLSVGVSHEAALKMVNSALMIKSGEESLATLDVATIDLFTGRADFYKAGAAPTYMIKNGRAGYIESASLPAGILRGIAFEHSVMSLRENDVIVLVSDGVTATGCEWVKSELDSLKEAGLQRLCERLASTAKARRNDNHEDDITVLAVALRRSDTATQSIFAKKTAR